MLVISRKVGEKISIGGGIEVCVVSIDGPKAKIGVLAPLEIPILRGEIRCPSCHSTDTRLDLNDRHCAGCGRTYEAFPQKNPICKQS